MADITDDPSGRSTYYWDGADWVEWDKSVTVSSLPAVSGTVSTKTALTASAPSSVFIGVVSAEAVPANANRKGLILTNVSINGICLSFGASPAVYHKGIKLNPDGVFWMDEYSFTTAAVNAIAGGAMSNLLIQEFV